MLGLWLAELAKTTGRNDSVWTDSANHTDQVSHYTAASDSVLQAIADPCRI